MGGVVNARGLRTKLLSLHIPVYTETGSKCPDPPPRRSILQAINAWEEGLGTRLAALEHGCCQTEISGKYPHAQDLYM